MDLQDGIHMDFDICIERAEIALQIKGKEEGEEQIKTWGFVSFFPPFILLLLAKKPAIETNVDEGALSHIEVSNYLLLQALLSLQMFAKNSIGQPSGP